MKQGRKEDGGRKKGRRNKEDTKEIRKQARHALLLIRSPLYSCSLDPLRKEARHASPLFSDAAIALVRIVRLLTRQGGGRRTVNGQIASHHSS